jgi:capsular exopolysaccharide synthesis family protein
MEFRSFLEGFLNRVADMFSLPKITLSSARSPTHDPAETQKQAELVDMFLGRLNVVSAGHSRVIRITFESTSPETAAQVVNTLADEYLQNQIKIKSDAARSASEWISSRIAVYRDKAEAARIQIERYRRESGLFQANKETTLTGQEAATVNQQLAAARAQEINLQVRLISVRYAVQQGRLDSVPEIVQSATIRAFRQAEETIRTNLASLQIQYGSEHPSIVQARAQLDGVRRSITQEINRIVHGLTDDLEREQTNVARLSAQLTTTKSTAADQNEAAARLVTLDRELASNDALYTMFLDRAKQTELQETTQQADAWVVSHADVPQFPYFPRTSTLLALAMMAAMLASGAIVLALGRKKETLEGIEQTRTALGLNVLGVLPQVRRLPRSPDGRQLYLMRDKRTPFADAMRNLHVRIGVSPTAMPKFVMFASALPGEGKTTTAIAFAVMLANVGRRVIVVDCDSHRPRVHEVLGVSRSPGLTSYLEGADRQSVVHTNSTMSIDVIPAGPSALHPASLLGSARMKDLLGELANQYDVIIIDSPPMLAVPDALVVAPLVDKTLFLVRWGKTPQAAAERAVQLLTEAGASAASAVLSLVDTEKMAAASPEESYRREVERYREV